MAEHTNLVLALNALAALVGHVFLFVHLLRWCLGVAGFRTRIMRGTEATRPLRILARTFVHAGLYGADNHAKPEGFMFRVSLRDRTAMFAHAEYSYCEWNKHTTCKLLITCTDRAYAAHFGGEEKESGEPCAGDSAHGESLAPGARALRMHVRSADSHCSDSHTVKVARKPKLTSEQERLIRHFTDKSRFDLGRVNELGRGRHGIVIYGQKGTGKTTVARELLAALGVEDFVNLKLFVGEFDVGDIIENLDGKRLGFILDEGLENIIGALHDTNGPDQRIRPLAERNKCGVNNAFDIMLEHGVVIVTSNLAPEAATKALEDVNPAGSIMDRLPFHFEFNPAKKTE